MTKPIRPEDLLPDGVDSTALGGTEVRKGSVGAFVANVRLLEQLAAESPERPAVEAELRRLVPALQAVGVFEVFVPRSPELAALIEQAQPGTA